MDDEFISTADAAKLAKMSVEHLRRLTRDGTVKRKKFGYFTMVSRPSLLAYLKTDRSPGRRKKEVTTKKKI